MMKSFSMNSRVYVYTENSVCVQKFRNFEFGIEKKITCTSNEPCHEETFLCHFKGADQLHGNHSDDQHLCFCWIDCIIPLLLKSEISSL